MQRTSVNTERSAVIVVQTGNGSTHLRKRGNNSTHWTFLYRGISIDDTTEVLSSQDTRHKAGGGAAVSDIKGFNRSFKMVKPQTMDADNILLILDGDAHFLKTGDRGQTVRSLKEAVNLCDSVCESTQHNAAMGD